MENDDVMSKEEYGELIEKLKEDAERTGDYEVYWLIRLMTEAGLRLTEAIKINRNNVWDGAVSMITKEGKVEVRFPIALRRDFTEFIFRGETRQAASTFWLFDGDTSDMLKAKTLKLLKDLGVRVDLQNIHAFRRAYLRWNDGDIQRKKR